MLAVVPQELVIRNKAREVGLVDFALELDHRPPMSAPVKRPDLNHGVTPVLWLKVTPRQGTLKPLPPAYDHIFAVSSHVPFGTGGKGKEE